MEGVSASMRQALKKYWRRRGYKRLINGFDSRRRNEAELGAGGGRRRRRWRFKVVPKIRIPRISSPKKMALWVRDAYVRMMVGLASSKVVSMGVSVTGDSFGRAPPPKEYDDKIMVRMYNSLIMAQEKKLHHGSSIITV
ncbi:uncharacterized protein LOC130731069 [Lotus japonicus]|uniref:uncharacterized protein LOC130731069 n=1 Tax=Lotus japonicus TaxID=34305 RepID=UPI00258ECEC2|nr:uncharacterized protein LOC130731069 [Lotus japonicus]